MLPYTYIRTLIYAYIRARAHPCITDADVVHTRKRVHRHTLTHAHMSPYMHARSTSALTRAA